MLLRVATGGSTRKPATAMPKEEKEQAAIRAAYEAADETFDGGTHYWDERITRITFNLEEYLGIHPKRAVYLVDIDRVIRLPKDIEYVNPCTSGNPRLRLAGGLAGGLASVRFTRLQPKGV